MLNIPTYSDILDVKYYKLVKIKNHADLFSHFGLDFSEVGTDCSKSELKFILKRNIDSTKRILVELNALGLLKGEEEIYMNDSLPNLIGFNENLQKIASSIDEKHEFKYRLNYSKLVFDELEKLSDKISKKDFFFRSKKELLDSVKINDIMNLTIISNLVINSNYYYNLFKYEEKNPTILKLKSINEYIKKKSDFTLDFYEKYLYFDNVGYPIDHNGEVISNFKYNAYGNKSKLFDLFKKAQKSKGHFTFNGESFKLGYFSNLKPLTETSTPQMLRSLENLLEY